MTKKNLLGLWVLWLLAGVVACRQERRFDDSFTMSPNSYKPYDNRFFYDELKHLDSGMVSNNKPLLEFFYGNKPEVFVAMMPRFYPSSDDISALKDWVARGNNALIFSYNISPELQDSLFTQPGGGKSGHFPPFLERIQYGTRWHFPTDTTLNGRSYRYPGHQPAAFSLDSVAIPSGDSILSVEPLLVNSEDGRVQLLKIRCGEGNIYYSNAPIMFSNYFLLHGDNRQFLNEFIREADLQNRHIIWDMYYRNPPDNDSETMFQRVMKVLGQYPAMRWAFLLLLLGTVLYVWVNSRRIEQPIPIIPPPENDALGLAKVLSNLYWNQQDHAAIAAKMVLSLQDYLTTKYHIYPKELTIDNTEKIAAKTNVDVALARDLIRQIRHIEQSGNAVDANDVEYLYRLSQQFYQQTQ